MKEPAVSIQMKYDATPNANVDNTDIAAGVVISKCGTLNSKIFYNGSDVLREFTPNGKITRDTDPTVIHASAIADIIPVYLRRVFDVSFNQGKRVGIAVDENGNTQLVIGSIGSSYDTWNSEGDQQYIHQEDNEYNETHPVSTTTTPDPFTSTSSTESPVSSDEPTSTSIDLSKCVAVIWSVNPEMRNMILDYFGVNPDNLNEVELIITNNWGRQYDYVGGLNPNYVNNYGRNQFIENINEYADIPFYIQVTEYGRSLDLTALNPTQDKLFGYYDNLPTYNDPAQRQAIFTQLVDQEDYKLAFYCPFGYANPSYAQFLSQLATKNWAFVPFGVMGSFNNDPDSIKNAMAGAASDHMIKLAPYDKNQGLTDYVVDLSLEVAYIRTVEANAARSCKFAPVMGSANGTMVITKPNIVLSKSVRESLLDANIMSIISKPTQSLNYLNKNKCALGDTILSEEQNMRMACQINRDITELLVPMLGRFNTQETRSLVISIINQYFQNNILNQVYSIDSYNVICDETNNPAEVRAANQLVVDINVTYLNAIWEVNVYHRALNVAQTA